MVTKNQLVKAQLEDPSLHDMMTGTKMIKYPYQMKDGILCYVKYHPPVLVIPLSYQDQFIKAIHDHPMSGHFGS